MSVTVNTPQFQATRVQFEDSLAPSIARGDGHVAPTEPASMEPTRLNGDNVDSDAVDCIQDYARGGQA